MNVYLPELLFFHSGDLLFLLFHPLKLKSFVFVDDGPFFFPGGTFRCYEGGLGP